MSKEKIMERLEALKGDLQSLQHRMSAVQGAILDCEYWLAVIEEKDGTQGTA